MISLSDDEIYLLITLSLKPESIQDKKIETPDINTIRQIAERFRHYAAMLMRKVKPCEK